MLKTLFIDFDGVLRHWDGRDIAAAENHCDVPLGSFYKTAFQPNLLTRAITGALTHQEWSEQIEKRLSDRYGQVSAKHLVAAWSQAAYQIDHGFLDALRQTLPGVSIVLVTNATSKLPADLKAAGLSEAFKEIVNSSEIGVAKPDPRFYEQALLQAKTTATASLYLDDSAANIAAARELGLTGHLHDSAASSLAFISRAALAAS